MAEAGATIKITIRQSSGEQFEVTIAPSSTVLELKTQCTEKTQLPAESQRLIFKGKIMKDAQTLASYEIADGLTVHLVRGKTAAAAGQPSAATAATNAPAAGTGADPMAGLGGMGGMPPGMGGMGGMPPGMMGMPGMGMPGMGMPGMPGMPGMAAGAGGPNGMGGMGGMDPAMMGQMMQNPMVQQMLSNPEFMQNMIQ